MAGRRRPLFIDLRGRKLLLLAALIAAVWLLVLGRVVLVPFGFVLMLTATLHPFVVRLEQRGLTRPLAVGIVMAAFVLLPLMASAALAPFLIAEVRSFAAQVPLLANRADALLHDWGIASQVEQAIAQADIQGRLEQLAVVTARQTAILLLKLAAVVIASGYLLADGHRLLLWLHILAPRRWEPHIEPLLAGLEHVVGGYILGQVITSALFGIFATALCFALGVPNPLLLGIVAAIGDIIPLFGVQLAMVLTMLVAFTAAPWKAAGVFVGYVIYGQLEAHLLVPRVYARTVSLPSLLVLLATIVGAALDGFIGIVVAIPIAGSAKVIVEYLRQWHAAAQLQPGGVRRTRRRPRFVAEPAPTLSSAAVDRRLAAPRIETAARLRRRRGRGAPVAARHR